MKKLSEAGAADFAILLDRFRGLAGFTCAREAAEALVAIVYDHFRDSLVLLRLFATVPFTGLPLPEREFVNRRAEAAGIAQRITDRTPILTWLASRGESADWQVRERSQRFRCIPLTSGDFVASLSMLSAQFRAMSFGPGLVDQWEAAFAGACPGRYTGTLRIRNAASDRDEEGRMIVPVQEFVTAHRVTTVLGFGESYGGHPGLLTLFAFTNETIERSVAEPLALLLAAYRDVTERFMAEGRVFSDIINKGGREDAGNHH